MEKEILELVLSLGDNATTAVYWLIAAWVFKNVCAFFLVWYLLGPLVKTIAKFIKEEME